MGSTTPQSRDALAIAHAAYCLPVSLTPSAPLALTISELINFRDTQPTPAPVQRFGGAVTAALTWVEVRMVRYSFPV